MDDVKLIINIKQKCLSIKVNNNKQYNVFNDIKIGSKIKYKIYVWMPNKGDSLEIINVQEVNENDEEKKQNDEINHLKVWFIKFNLLMWILNI